MAMLALYSKVPMFPVSRLAYEEASCFIPIWPFCFLKKRVSYEWDEETNETYRVSYGGEQSPPTFFIQHDNWMEVVSFCLEEGWSPSVLIDALEEDW